jgi:hypothetical protein
MGAEVLEDCKSLGRDLRQRILSQRLYLNKN